MIAKVTATRLAIGRRDRLRLRRNRVRHLLEQSVRRRNSTTQIPGAFRPRPYKRQLAALSQRVICIQSALATRGPLMAGVRAGAEAQLPLGLIA